MNLSGALENVRTYNKQGMACSLSCLAVTVHSERLIKKEVGRYITTLKEISEHKLNADVTVKMHQLGIYVDEKIAYKAVEEIVMAAERYKNFVWIDMYLPDTVDVTIKIFLQLREKYQNVGICLQAYLERTENDLREILKEHCPLRLVKGFYKEHDFDRWDDVTKNYENLLSYMLTHSDRPAIATHDPEIIEKAKQAIRGSGSTNAEFQFFKLVRDDLARELVKEGYQVRIYIPFGNVWSFLLREGKTFNTSLNFKRLMRFLFSRFRR
jgi:proline dehydrogenase